MEKRSTSIENGDNLRVRLAPVLQDMVRREARCRGVSVAELIRNAVVADLRRPLAGRDAGGIDNATE